MPYYQYRCNNCEHEFEKRQRMSDEPLTICPVCDGRIRRVVNSVGVVFKGSGFYVTDTRNGSSASSNGSSKTAETSTSENGSSTSTPAETTKTETTKTETVKSGSESKTKEPAAAK